MTFLFSHPLKLLAAALSIGLLISSFYAGAQAQQPFEAKGFSADTVLGKAKNWMHRGYGTQAKAIYQAYLAQHPNHPEALFGLGQIAFREGQYNEAQRYLERVIGLEPYNVDAIAELGHVYHHRASNPMTGDAAYKASALEQFQKAAGLNPDNIRLLTYEGLYLLDEGDRVSAQRKLSRALSQNSNFVPALLGMARYHMAIGNVQQAKSLAFQATEIDSQNSDAYFLMAQMLGKAEHPDKAVTYGLKSESVDFGINPERDLFLAEQYEKLGQKTKALEYFGKVSTLNPNHSATLLKMAQLHEQTGNTEQSTAMFQKAAQLDPAIVDNMLRQANDALRAEQTQAASTQYLKALAMAPERKTEISSALASAAMIDAYYQQADPSLLRQAASALSAAQGPTLTETAASRMAMDALKLKIAASGTLLHQLTPTLRAELTQMSQSTDDLVAGEALFLLGQYAKAQQRLDAVDGITANGYLQVGDRLLAMQALESARTMYQRGMQMENLSSLRQGLERITLKQGLAQQRLKQGNDLYALKDYTTALQKYQDAQKIMPEMDSTYLRLGDTYEQLKDTVNAFAAYRRAVELNPGLMSSEGFAKRYTKLQKAATKAQAKSNKAGS